MGILPLRYSLQNFSASSPSLQSSLNIISLNISKIIYNLCANIPTASEKACSSNEMFAKNPQEANFNSSLKLQHVQCSTYPLPIQPLFKNSSALLIYSHLLNAVNNPGRIVWQKPIIIKYFHKVTFFKKRKNPIACILHNIVF